MAMVSTKAVTCHCHLLLPPSGPLRNSDQQCEFLNTIHTDMWEMFHIVSPYVTYFSKTQTYTKTSSRSDANLCNVGNTFAIRKINSIPGQLTWNPRLAVSIPPTIIHNSSFYLHSSLRTNVTQCQWLLSSCFSIPSFLAMSDSKKKALKQFAEQGGSANNSVKQELQYYCRSARRHTDRMAKWRHCYNMHVAKLATHDMNTD